MGSFSGSFFYTFFADETYYLSAGLVGGITGSYTFKVTRPTQMSSIEILSYPNKMDYYEFEDFNYNGLSLKITDEKGKIYYWSDWSDDIGGYRLEIYPRNDQYGKYQYSEIACGGATDTFAFNIHYDQNGYKDGYSLEAFGSFVFVSDPFGDVNGDGASDIRDLIRLKKLLANATQEGADKADLDGDGNLGSTDAAKMRIYLLRKIDI